MVELRRLWFLKNEEILKLKENLDVIALCGENFRFLSQILIYLKIINEKKKKLDFDVIFELLSINRKRLLKEKRYTKSKFTFLEELKQKLREFKLSGKAIPEDKKLKKLFQAYPVDLIQLYDNLI